MRVGESAIKMGDEIKLSRKRIAQLGDNRFANGRETAVVSNIGKHNGRKIIMLAHGRIVYCDWVEKVN